MNRTPLLLLLLPLAALAVDFDAGETLTPAPREQRGALAGFKPTPPVSVTPKTMTYDTSPKQLLIEYEEGTEEQRLARVIEEPGAGGNKVLHFELRKPNVMDKDGQPLKGRIQIVAPFKPDGAKQLRFTVRLYLFDGFAALRQMPGAMKWLTLGEWWNNVAFNDEGFGFRWSLHIVKDAGAGAPLRFYTFAQTATPGERPEKGDGGGWSRPVWEQTNTTVDVPIGAWFTLDYRFREGDAATGRWIVGMTPDGGERVEVFDITGFTRHPDDPAPNGLTVMHAPKLYTANETIDWVTAQGATLQVYWDDLDFRICKEDYDPAISPCMALQ